MIQYGVVGLLSRYSGSYLPAVKWTECETENFQLVPRLATHTVITAGAQLLRCCVTNRKVAGSIPDGLIGIFH